MLNLHVYWAIFNARIANGNDFVNFYQNEHAENDISEFIEDYTRHLDEAKMSVYRNSKGKIKDRYGRFLLNFCKGNNMFILNGRAGYDKNIGKFTCRNATESVVDCSICSPGVLQLFCEFDILKTGKLYML